MGRKVRLLGVWVQAPLESFLKFRGLKMSFPEFSTGHFSLLKISRKENGS